jgi:hypothetical protein
VLFVVGVIAVAAGLAMVLGHNVWSGGVLPVVITLTGWLLIDHLLRNQRHLFQNRPTSLNTTSTNRHIPNVPCAAFKTHKARVRRASGFLLTALLNARRNTVCSRHHSREGAPPIKH